MDNLFDCRLSHQQMCCNYVAFPNAKQPRWVFPADNPLRKAAFKLCTPHSVRGKFLKKLWEYNVLHGEPVCLNEEYLILLKAKLADLHGASDLHLAFYIGTPGTFQKITSLCITGSGKTIFFGKIAFEPLAKLSLQRENDNLTKLRACPDLHIHVPQVLGNFDLHDSAVLVTTAGPDRSGGISLRHRHKEFMDKINASFSQQCRFNCSTAWVMQQKIFDEIRSHITHVWLKRYDAAFNKLDKCLGSEPVSVTLAHRDFVPWNMRRYPDGKIYVFDWEFAQEGYLTLHDYFHFNFMTNLMLHGTVSLRQVNTWLNFAESDRAPLHFLAYLTDMALFYQKSSFDRGDYADGLVLRTVAGLLDGQFLWQQGRV